MDGERDTIEAGVAARFTALALEPGAEQRFAVGRESALALGYPAAELDRLPACAVEAFAGVGDPFAMGQPRQGETVLDAGCGAGLDALRAALRVGEGRVIGVDCVPEMLVRARQAAATAGRRPVEFLAGRADALPVPDASVDLAITNGVLNLCVNKRRVLEEIHRVLRPGGRLQMADILLEPHVTPDEAVGRGAWSD